MALAFSRAPLCLTAADIYVNIWTGCSGLLLMLVVTWTLLSTEMFFIGDYFESTLLVSGKKPGGNSLEAGPDIFRMKLLLTLRT